MKETKIKLCSGCGVELPLGYKNCLFNSRRCMDCVRVWRAENHKKKRQKSLLSGPYQYIGDKFSVFVHTSGQRGITWGLTRRNLVELWEYQGGICPYTGVKLDFSSKDDRFYPSLDRFDCSKGYVQGNVCWCSNWFNITIKKSIPFDYIEKGMPLIFDVIKNFECKFSESDVRYERNKDFEMRDKYRVMRKGLIMEKRKILDKADKLKGQERVDMLVDNGLEEFIDMNKNGLDDEYVYKKEGLKDNKMMDIEAYTEYEKKRSVCDKKEVLDEIERTTKKGFVGDRNKILLENGLSEFVNHTKYAYWIDGTPTSHTKEFVIPR